MTAEQIQPIAPSKRIAIIDMLRGWALLGVVLMNYSDIFWIGRPYDPKYNPDMLTNILQYSGSFLFAAKSWTMLSLLFGYGFAVLIRNVANKGINPVKFFTIRMFWLFVIAFVNCMFWWGDILKDYALMGLILLFFYKMKPKPAFILCIVLFLALPAIAPLVNKMPYNGEERFNKLLPLYHSHNIIDNFKFNLVGTYEREVKMPAYAITVHLTMLLCFLLGYSAQRINFFENLAGHKKYLKRVFWYTLVLTILLTVFFITGQKLKWTYYRYINLRYPAILIMMLFTVSALGWLYINGKLKAFFRSLENIGKMTLTNYMVQNIILFFVFGGVGLNLGNTMPYWFYLAFPLGIYIIQVYFSKWWLSRYNYGIVEWIWRQLSYNKRLPLRKS
ncbi:DUF418 domain-containing protein [Mucilaginibacter boryungensis]|uniref:DUF418 domain-containing protein n=1 Tax=Mucilaginibacter boryungensis TaxID=768480 RepID=A0ABR9XFQ2_9SPHI|nr:DUF418 domain-containing protein [Mucilaginibacter boryungensis]MBE9666212.1 DUF418 domain-containing protein [Mucilaginibacter boryungensis]